LIDLKNNWGKVKYFRDLKKKYKINEKSREWIPCPFAHFAHFAHSFKVQPCARKSFRPFRPRATMFKKDRPEGPIRLKGTGPKGHYVQKGLLDVNYRAEGPQR
jgi:hypothetical protein